MIGEDEQQWYCEIIYSMLLHVMCVCVGLSVVSNSLWPRVAFVAHQAPLSLGFSREEYWGGLPFPSPGDLPNPGIEPMSSAL